MRLRIGFGGLAVMLAVLIPAYAWTALFFQRPAFGQTTVVKPEDVTTPVAVPGLLPTPTPLPAPRPDGSRLPLPAGTAGEQAPSYDGEGYESMTGSNAGYVVKEGDTLWTVALEIGLDLDDVPCIVSPDFTMDTPLVIGDTLVQPAGELICHEVMPGDTPASVAAEYGVDPSIILSDPWNGLGGAGVDAALAGLPRPDGSRPRRYMRIVKAGAATVSPGFFATMLDRPVKQHPMLAVAQGGPVRTRSTELVPANWPYGSGYFEWPSPGWITQGYRNDHRAIDIAAPAGTAVTAADRGVVVRAGWNEQGYGMFVVVDHNIDYVTLYSHLDDIFVEEGDVVAQGEVLGTVGSTGNSTGPHLHFEVRDFGTRINPLEVLLR